MLCRSWEGMIGDLLFEEKQLIDYICETGLRETRKLLSIVTSQAQTEGAILAFETIQDAGFTTIEDLLAQYRLLGAMCDAMRENFDDDRILFKFWKLRGQQLQFQFILDRLLAYRVMTQGLDCCISARAAIYVGEWMKSIGVGQ